MNTTPLVSFRSHIRSLIRKGENIWRRLLRGVAMFFCLWAISTYFGYSDFLSNNLIILAVSFLCCFLPMSAGAFILGVYIVLQLLSLAVDIAGTVLLLFALSYILAGSYQAKHFLHFGGITALYQVHIPFIAPLWGGLFGGMQEVCTIIGGCTISYYLKLVRDASPRLLSTDEPVSALQILQGMFSNPMFYIYLTAMITMFVIISFVRNLSIAHSWLLAVFAGALAEFIIMTGGYLFVDGRERIPELAVTNLIVLVAGAVLYFIFQDLDYARIERAQFEDDDYYYYVKAVPKIHLAMEDKQVVNITAEEQAPEQELTGEERSTSE